MPVSREAMFVARFVAAACWRSCGQIFVTAASCSTKICNKSARVSSGLNNINAFNCTQHEIISTVPASVITSRFRHVSVTLPCPLCRNCSYTSHNLTYNLILMFIVLEYCCDLVISVRQTCNCADHAQLSSKAKNAVNAVRPCEKTYLNRSRHASLDPIGGRFDDVFM